MIEAAMCFFQNQRICLTVVAVSIWHFKVFRFHGALSIHRTTATRNIIQMLLDKGSVCPLKPGHNQPTRATGAVYDHHTERRCSLN